MWRGLLFLKALHAEISREFFFSSLSVPIFVLIIDKGGLPWLVYALIPHLDSILWLGENSKIDF
jgi:hypothetical protein